LLTLLLVVLSCFCFYLGRRKIYGPITFPIVGNISQFKNSTKIQTNYQLAQRYGEIFRVKMGPLEIYKINDGLLAKRLFLDFADNGKGRYHFPIFLALEMDGRGTVHNDMNDRWKAANTFIHQMVGIKHIEKCYKASQEILSSEFIELDKIASSSSSSQSKDWLPTTYCTLVFTRIIVKAVYGGVLLEKSLEDEVVKVILSINWYVQNLQPHEIFQFVNYSNEFRTNLNNQIKINQSVFDKVVALHKNNLDPNNPRDILDEILIHQVEEKWDNLDAKAIITNILGGGILNAAQTAAWFIAYMGKYPEIQNKIREELDKVVGKERLPQLNDNPKLIYFNATLNEVMRSRPLASETLFHTVNEDFECDGYFFKKNSQLVVNIYNVHHNPKYWKDPDNFNPERFINWDETSPHFIPFSIGPRSCAGFRVAKATLFYFLTSILQRYQIAAPEKFEIPPWNFAALLLPQDFKVFLKSL